VFETSRRQWPEKRFRYATITVAGGLDFHIGTHAQARAAIGAHGAGEAGIDFIPNLPPLAMYYFVPFEGDHGMPMNKVANGIFWELSRPVDPATIDPDRDDLIEAAREASPEDRIVKLRGPVVIYGPGGGSFGDDHEATIREAHKVAAGRLKSRGWL